jgi:hypothetical protein
MADTPPIPAPELPDGKLLEGIVTTRNTDGSPHVAPMGPIVDSQFNTLLLRPFRPSTTYQNLKRTGRGVLHVTDDAELFAQAAVGKLERTPRLAALESFEGDRLLDACRWFAFRVLSIDDKDQRTSVVAEVVDRGVQRDFFGFNRAKHAVIEAAILATRLHILDSAHVLAEFDRLQGMVEKTGGREEHNAFNYLRDHIERQLAMIDRAKAVRR